LAVGEDSALFHHRVDRPMLTPAPLAAKARSSEE
jgi:hypothetical protein